MIYWFTGQPGAGKTSLAHLLQTRLNNGLIIDGDDIRQIFNNQDYSELGRRKNIELAQNIAKFHHYKGNTAIVSLVSPYRDQREKFKLEMGNYIKEIYVYTSDIRDRELFHVSNYELPLTNFIGIDTTNKKEIESFNELYNKLIND